jgi:hypothetical protein
MTHKKSYKYILLSVFMEKGIFSDFYFNRYRKPTVYGPVFYFRVLAQVSIDLLYRHHINIDLPAWLRSM